MYNSFVRLEGFKTTHPRIFASPYTRSSTLRLPGSVSKNCYSSANIMQTSTPFLTYSHILLDGFSSSSSFCVCSAYYTMFGRNAKNSSMLPLTMQNSPPEYRVQLLDLYHRHYRTILFLRVRITLVVLVSSSNTHRGVPATWRRDIPFAWQRRNQCNTDTKKFWNRNHPSTPHLQASTLSVSV
jgi:hypothetical protein